MTPSELKSLIGRLHGTVTPECGTDTADMLKLFCVLAAETSWDAALDALDRVAEQTSAKENARRSA